MILKKDLKPLLVNKIDINENWDGGICGKSVIGFTIPLRLFKERTNFWEVVEGDHEDSFKF